MLVILLTIAERCNFDCAGVERVEWWIMTACEWMVKVKDVTATQRENLNRSVLELLGSWGFWRQPSKVNSCGRQIFGVCMCMKRVYQNEQTGRNNFRRASDLCQSVALSLGLQTHEHWYRSNGSKVRGWHTKQIFEPIHCLPVIARLWLAVGLVWEAQWAQLERYAKAGGYIHKLSTEQIIGFAKEPNGRCDMH